ncbi:hypothetical protein [uncultured Erythrobacter sp.]|uniref:hypothetical protein n=1 Tax=uncultured Erythrobacter sp. TaxID=263913 RepID=UPI00263316AD|nr:hypothetical protein [uncultured Erythrobacter sp.]
MIRSAFALAAAATVFLPPSIQASSSRKVYDYNALGRLRQVCNHADSNAFAEERDYAYDKAGNRSATGSRDNVRSISAGQQWTSDNGQFRLVMQGDGNLVLYQGGAALWASNTVGSGANRAIMQADGNLVLRTSSNTPVWATGTHRNHCARLQIQNDGNVVIYSKNSAVLWATNTSGL